MQLRLKGNSFQAKHWKSYILPDYDYIKKRLMIVYSSATNYYFIALSHDKQFDNPAGQLDHKDFNSEFSLIHLAKLQSRAFLVSLSVP